ncbi:MAG: type II/IV secretion system protein [Candidatus Kerfeldbacteria bacterium]|nr:type II/IV secretion system protein [Candidatus Kerfeldbacteria bacterium]
MHLASDQLQKVLVDTGLVTTEDWQKATTEAGRSGQQVVDILIGQGTVTEDFVAETLAEHLGLPVVDLKKVEAPINYMEILPENVAKGRGLVIYGEQEGALLVAMEDPLDLQTVEYLKFRTGKPVRVALSAATGLKYTWRKYKKDIGKEFKRIIEENIAKTKAAGGDAAKQAKDMPIISILDTIISHAVAHNSSDIHMEPWQEEVVVRFRVDGILQDIISLPSMVHSALVARVKILSNLQIDEHFKPQDGRFKFKTEDGEVAIRVSVMPTFHGEKVVLRLLASSVRPLSMNELGLSDKNIAILENNTAKTHGLILVTGPTGSGKTTTLYTALHKLNTPAVNICTIEDPIEYDIPRINQTQVNVKAGITFAEGLKSFLRQNPNIMMVGEIRDKETLEMAIHASLTGHLVLSTLHTNDAASAVPRLLDMGAEPFLLASTLNLVIAQRLVRRLCQNCVVSEKINKELVGVVKEQLALNPHPHFNVNDLTMRFRGQGCPICGGQGYVGQLGIFELLEVNNSVRELIMERTDAVKLQEMATKNGMETMFEDGLTKVQRGITTMEEVLRVVRE